jgi:small subunit ribosomal protein S7
MSRRHKAEKREINPDPKFGDLVVTKFMNAIMYDGKKSVAETIVYSAFDAAQSKSAPAASAVRPIRSRSTFVRSAVRLSRSAG